MHSLVCFTLLLVVGTLPTGLVQAGLIKEQCMAEVGVTAHDVADRHVNDDPGVSVKCFFRCFFEKLGIMTDNKIIPGAFGRAVGHLITEEGVQRMDETCNLFESETSDEDSCEFAWQITECYEGLKMSDARHELKARMRRE
ncbi:general odorant-binding protein 56a [Drosophila santomea]|uniref:general odorant-binding protein 56a n=1 Tax=Drosophila santomea TaxID=129105 RepID=UPI001954106B|nr:general odorant-binding protein 56a [Drosophila santomea]